MPARSSRRLLRPLLAVLALAAGCDNIERAGPRPRPARVDPSLRIESAQILRGTVASETIMRGYNPVIVRGYGLVVGLEGTGSRDIPPALRAHMLAEMARRGIGSESAGFGHLKPEAMLDSPDTAVVIVEGIVPPGAVGRLSTGRGAIRGTRFDVRVFADPRTGTTSLDGGRLYTAELRPVLPGDVLPPVGSRQASPIAEAGGPLFINPFSAPDALEQRGIDLTIGRIMNGGEVLRDIPIKLRLASPSHARAEIIQSSVNARFPQEPGQRDPTARGESGETIRITIPTSFRARPDEFIELLRHMTIRRSGAEAVAASVKRALLRDPGYAAAASWRWEALGAKALPTARTLYDTPQERPRLAALRAGARMDDALATPHLIQMTKSGSANARREAASLLGEMRLDPQIDVALRALLDDADIDVRLAAYEAQIKRNDPYITRDVVDGKFVVDVVPSERPLIYVTQIGQPRIAIFGADLTLERPMRLDAWSGRLLAKAEADDEKIEVYYRTENGDRMIELVDPRVSAFTAFLGHTSTIDAPAPGLGLSYSEAVSALYEVWRSKLLKADFKAEQDRVAAAIRRQMQGTEIQDRPEFSDPDYDFLLPAGETTGGGESGSDAMRAATPRPEVGP
ncbi:MAG: hypothetical protein HKO59_05915 [Phycisphaerales bacterium]|nr:flagellar basal body P-ring protein FlgI [Phycisphaerae bacterium]NNF42040.1 hypothetical protein [Phycisphaerales bacterium]NNM25508.1 hypothetical protein [Phycisphaerales bacterium]